MRRYNLTTPADLVAWLDDDASGEQQGDDIFDLLGVNRLETDSRQWFRIEATFGLPGSLLIRSSSGEPGSPDVVHLKSDRQGQQQPIISGTSLAGAVRSRALRIANTVLGQDKAKTLVNEMFGPPMNEDEADTTRTVSAAGRLKPGGSRVVTEESIVQGGRDCVQSRVKIDRFTGGAFPTALFSEQPLFSNGQAQVTLSLTLRNPKETEIGLLLLVLKDLWTGDLPLGGQSSIGRGRLEGRHAVLTMQRDGDEQRWKLQRDGDELRCEPPDALAALNAYVTRGLSTPEPSGAAQGETA